MIGTGTLHLIGTGTLSRVAQVEAYANHLGMDAQLDLEFLYIAEWALTAPVPDGWNEHMDEAGGGGGGGANNDNLA